eukprot:CAMPEP_0116869166 /NCGR_PEP_ID=MMETSP0418-20121206/27610_1 /TAXON_ID=1158023 /ORGANISM="Astrosyne radiata, Strain 13vi08-1A" /LENGTH=263 /DNA_ID=CAMNT_0004505235 /DNA_START=26 /DNA_END=817 /DNA_ORIENTATION=+
MTMNMMMNDCEERKETRRVRFAPLDDEEYAPIPQWYIDAQNDEERRQSWWANDQAEIKKSALKVVDSVLDGCDSVWASRERQTYRETLSQVHDACLEDRDMGPSLQEDLKYWVRVGHARRGLERYSIDEIHFFREQRKSHCMAAVMLVQDTCWEQQDCNNMSDDEAAKLIRSVSESVSFVAARYAAVMAAADEHAARKEYESILPPQQNTEDNKCYHSCVFSSSSYHQQLQVLKPTSNCSNNATTLRKEFGLLEKRVAGPAAA